MKSGDAAAAEVVEDYIDYLACGLTNILRIFQPDVLSIGGGICNEGDNLLVPLKKKIDEMLHLPDYAKKTEIKIAEMGNDAGIMAPQRSECNQTLQPMNFPTAYTSVSFANRQDYNIKKGSRT